MNTLKYIALIFVTITYSAQSFNYQRIWGTYLGGANNRIIRLYESQGNVFLDGSVFPYSTSASAAYYNQFITPGAQGFQSGLTANNTNALSLEIQSSNATLQFYGYHSNGVIHRDNAGNYFKLANTGTPTAGVWLSAGVETGSLSNSLLEKYDVNNNLVWRTYMPHINYFNDEYFYDDYIKTDTEGNIYISGSTHWQSLGDPGTAYPGFTILNTLNPPNNYVVKLNHQGQKVWATYVPTNYDPVRISIYDNDLYILTHHQIFNNEPLFATPGAFDQSVSPYSSILLKFNASNGSRIWGTYYGSGANSGHNAQSIVAQADGVYLLGRIYYSYSSTDTNMYFGSTGAYQTVESGGNDWYLAKFGAQGARIWGTYYGSPDHDFTSTGFLNIDDSSGNMDVKNGKILISHVQNGSTNMSTPGAFSTVKPQQSTSTYDPVFTMFDTNGNHLFTSYYGGAPMIANAVSRINGKISDSGYSFYLYGSTISQTGFTEANAIQNTIIHPPSTAGTSVGFLAKFTSTALLTNENSKSVNIQIFDNPNEGNFSLKGNIFSKGQFYLIIYDISGKKILDYKLNRTEKQNFNLKNLITSGMYVLVIKNDKNEMIKTFKMMVK